MNNESSYLPVKGAATYQPEKLSDGRWAIVMYPDGENDGSVIQTCRNYQIATKAAKKWQLKENKAVLSNLSKDGSKT
jgi:hypothetical protein